MTSSNLKLLPLLLGLSLIFLSSCKDDDDMGQPGSETSRFIPLAVGNYWIYDILNYDLTTYSGVYRTYYDTIKVIGTTSIRDQQYFMLTKDVLSPSQTERKDTIYWRDSSDYLINHLGEIVFAAHDRDRILNRTDLSVSSLSITIDYTVKDNFFNEFTDLGTFRCLDKEGVMMINDERLENETHDYFAEDIGIIYSSVFYAGVPTSEIRCILKEYHLE